MRLSDNQRVLLIQREFRLAPDDLQVSVTVDRANSSVALYRPQNLEGT